MRPFCTCSPLTLQPELQVVRVVELVRGDQPGADRGEAGEGLAQAELRRPGPRTGTRSEMSWPTVSPATWSQASLGGDVARCPADHGDQLDLPVDGRPSGRTTAPCGPVSEETNLVNTGGLVRDGEPGFGGVSR